MAIRYWQWPRQVRDFSTREWNPRVLSSLYPNHRTVLLGARATENSFKKLANGFDLIHLATHGYFNKMNPLFSGLQLDADSLEDGRLEVHEIMGLRLKAKLVTLSACDTAVGGGYFSDVPPGDDLVGLTRAFLSTAHSFRARESLGA